nr:hypothetical protein FRC0375_00617 [Corynebacterium diphtheriae]
MSVNFTKEHAEIAAELIGRLAAYDSTAPAPSKIVLAEWATVIARSSYTREELIEALQRRFMRDGEPPRMKLAAIFSEAKRMRLDKPVRGELTAPQPARLVGADLNQAAYQFAIKVRCTACGATAGDPCMERGETRRIPHMKRMALGGKLHGH